MRHLRAFAAAAAMIGALAVAPASANAAYWVGLGDSFASGPLITRGGDSFGEDLEPERSDLVEID